MADPLTVTVTPPVTIAPDGNGNMVSNVQQVADAVNAGVLAYYNTRAQIELAKAAPKIARAQAQNAVGVAQTGLPSPNMLLLGGGALLLVLLLSKK